MRELALECEGERAGPRAEVDDHFRRPHHLGCDFEQPLCLGSRHQDSLVHGDLNRAEAGTPFDVLERLTSNTSRNELIEGTLGARYRLEAPSLVIRYDPHQAQY